MRACLKLALADSCLLSSSCTLCRLLLPTDRLTPSVSSLSHGILLLRFLILVCPRIQYLCTYDPCLDGIAMVASVACADCGASCSYRCSKSGRPKMCLRACNTCCQPANTAAASRRAPPDLRQRGRPPLLRQHDHQAQQAQVPVI